GPSAPKASSSPLGKKEMPSTPAHKLPQNSAMFRALGKRPAMPTMATPGSAFCASFKLWLCTVFGVAGEGRLLPLATVASFFFSSRRMALLLSKASRLQPNFRWPPDEVGEHPKSIGEKAPA